MKLNLGAGDSKFEGFISVDLYDPKADVQADICDLPYEANTVDEIVAYQVIEHVPYQKSEKMFEEMYRVLKPGGTAIVETPNIGYIAQDIAMTDDIEPKFLYSLVGEYYRPWDKDRYPDWDNCAAAIHRNPWTLTRLKRIVEPLGFKVEELQDKQIDVPENLAVRLTK